MTTREAAIRSIDRYYDDGRFLADLGRRVAIPTESQNPARRPELYRYLEDEIAPALRALGYAVTIYDNPDPAGGPFLIGRRIEDPDALTVLSYGHGDVVRGLDKDWRSGLSPWTITLDGDRIYGRGVVDNKGQHTINIAALAEVIAARGRLGFNSIFFVEMSEEVGSHGIHAFAQAQRAALAADLLIGSDGPRVTIDRPTIYLGSRGAMNLELTLNLREGGHHSGNWGGLLANPGIILAHAIASIVSKTGEILVPELRPKHLPSSIRKALEGIVIDGGADGPAIDPWWGEPGLSAAEKVFGWSTFEVLAYVTGNPDDAVNAVPPWASAHCQIRFTVDNDPAGFIPALRRHLDANGFAAIRVQEARGRVVWQATRLDPDHPAVQWAVASIQRTTGKVPALLPCVGGSMPNDVWADMLDMPTIWVPHSYGGCSQHAPNEHGLGSLMREGLEMMGGLFWDLAESPPDIRRPS